jgi:hypothetical protein
MRSHQVFRARAVLLAAAFVTSLPAAEPPPPALENFNVNGTTQSLRFPPYPGAQAYTFYWSTNAAGPYLVNSNFQLAPYITGYSTNIITNTPTIITNLAYEWRATNMTAPGDMIT